jgi:hypothetical protein
MAKAIKLPNELRSNDTATRSEVKALAVDETVKVSDTDQGKSTKAIMGEIKAIEKIFSSSTYEKVAVCAARIVVHAVKYGDVSLASHLVKALGTGWRGNDMHAWFETFGPFAWGNTNELDKDGKPIKGFKLNKEKRKTLEPRVASNEETAKFLGELKGKPMWTWKKEPEYKGFDFLAQLEALIKKADNVKNKPIAHPKDNVIGIELGRKALADAKQARAAAEAERMAQAEEVATATA